MRQAKYNRQPRTLNAEVPTYTAPTLRNVKSMRLCRQNRKFLTPYLPLHALFYGHPTCRVSLFVTPQNDAKWLIRLFPAKVHGTHFTREHVAVLKPVLGSFFHYFTIYNFKEKLEVRPKTKMLLQGELLMTVWTLD